MTAIYREKMAEASDEPQVPGPRSPKANCWFRVQSSGFRALRLRLKNQRIYHPNSADRQLAVGSRPSAMSPKSQVPGPKSPKAVGKSKGKRQRANERTRQGAEKNPQTTIRVSRNTCQDC